MIQFSLTDMSEFKDRDIPIFVEACAGSATLSFSIQRRGFEVYPIDHVRNRHQTQCRVLQLDLIIFVLGFILECRVALVLEQGVFH